MPRVGGRRPTKSRGKLVVVVVVGWPGEGEAWGGVEGSATAWVQCATRGSGERAGRKMKAARWTRVWDTRRTPGEGITSCKRDGGPVVGWRDGMRGRGPGQSGVCDCLPSQQPARSNVACLNAGPPPHYLVPTSSLVVILRRRDHVRPSSPSSSSSSPSPCLCRCRCLCLPPPRFSPSVPHPRPARRSPHQQLSRKRVSPQGARCRKKASRLPRAPARRLPQVLLPQCLRLRGCPACHPGV